MQSHTNTDPRLQQRGFDIDAWNARVAGGEFDKQPEPVVFVRPTIYQVAQQAVARAIAVSGALEKGQFLNRPLAEYSD